MAFRVARKLFFDPSQSAMVRQVLKQRSADPFVAVVDAPMNDMVAYTTLWGKVIYMDGDALRGRPHTFHNVLVHEILHTQGKEHDQTQIPGSMMSYAVTKNIQGEIIDDATFL